MVAFFRTQIPTQKNDYVLFSTASVYRKWENNYCFETQNTRRHSTLS